MTSWIQIFLAAIVGIFACFHYYYSIRKALIDIKKAEPLDETIIGKFWRKYKSHISIIIGVISFAFLGFIYGRQNSIREKECKKRIVVLLPLSEENKAAYQDGVRQAIGVVDFIKSKPQLSDQFEVGIRDHKMDANAAELIIKDEIRNGTKYFICTMSNVCTQVSENFDKIVQEYNTEGEKPILISTVASSPKIQTLKNLKYRFYVRSQEEGKVLAEYADKMSFPSAYGIAISDAYGHGAIEEFKTYWTVNKTWINQKYLGRETSTLDKVVLELSKVKKTIPPESLIFIAHYGNGIDNIVTALDSLGIKNPIFATSTLSVSDWRVSIKQILPKYEWFTCVPNYNTKEGYNDVIKDFLTFALERTTKCILAAEKDHTKSFDDFWRSQRVPENIDVVFDANGDMVIPMRCVSKNDLN